MPAVRFVGRKLIVNNTPISGYFNEILEDLVRKRKSLLFDLNPLLDVIAHEVTNPGQFINNAAAKQIMKNMVKADAVNALEEAAAIAKETSIDPVARQLNFSPAVSDTEKSAKV